MNYTFYQARESTTPPATAQHCVEAWSTQCPSAFEAPMDPHVVLGGPSETLVTELVRDSAAFVVTYPLVNGGEREEAVREWERAFLEEAGGKLSSLAASVGLRLSYSAER